MTGEKRRRAIAAYIEPGGRVICANCLPGAAVDHGAERLTWAAVIDAGRQGDRRCDLCGDGLWPSV